MKRFRRARLPHLALLAALSLAACERSKTPARIDSASPAPTGASDTSATTTARVWNPDIGPVLLVAAAAPTEAYVLLPNDSAARATFANIPRPASATLFGRAGSVQLANVPSVADSGSCMTATIAGAPPPHAWNLGFIGGVVAPIPVDSTESFTNGDSLAAVTWMNRLASALPNDSAGHFVGLPFVVHEMWRFSLPDGTQILAANVVRQLNQEATPLQENTLLVAERAAKDSIYTTAYSERSYGEEESIATHELIAAAQLGADKRPAIVVERDYGDSKSYVLIERVAAGRWRAGWSSPRLHC